MFPTGVVSVDRLQHEKRGLTTGLSETTTHRRRGRIRSLNTFVSMSTTLSTTIPILTLTVHNPSNSGSTVATSTQGHHPRSSLRSRFVPRKMHHGRVESHGAVVVHRQEPERFEIGQK